MKKLTALLVLCNSTVFAGTMGPVCTPGNVTVPCVRSGFDIGVHALYLKPAFSGSLYDYNFAGYDSNFTFTRKDNDWLWGINVEGSYHFGTGSDLSVNWYHINDHVTIFPPPFESLLSGNTLAYGYIRTDNQWDAVNLEFGQHADFGDFKDVRYHAGLQYAHLKLKNYAPVDVLDIEGTILASTFNETSESFNGIGPRVGMDLCYNFNPAFSIYGKLAGALLLGDAKSLDSSGGVLPFPNSSTLTIVPELDLKLGMAYTLNLANGSFSLDGGYMATTYFDPLGLPANVNASSNYGFHGPYFGVQYVGWV